MEFNEVLKVKHKLKVLPTDEQVNRMLKLYNDYCEAKCMLEAEAMALVEVFGVTFDDESNELLGKDFKEFISSRAANED